MELPALVGVLLDDLALDSLHLALFMHPLHAALAVAGVDERVGAELLLGDVGVLQVLFSVGETDSALVFGRLVDVGLVVVGVVDYGLGRVFRVLEHREVRSGLVRRGVCDWVRDLDHLELAGAESEDVADMDRYAEFLGRGV